VPWVVFDGSAYRQPFQGEPRGESPPARCPKPTRRDAGVANGLSTAVPSI
jgi:hypothetical protein